MVKIVQFIYSLGMGGAETIVKEYALGVDKKKFDVTVLCMGRYGTKYEELLEKKGIRVVYISDKLPFQGQNGILCKIIKVIVRFILVRKFIRKEKFDVIHIHLPLNEYIQFARPGKRTRIVYTQHFDATQWKNDCPKDVQALKYLIKKYPVQVIALNQEMQLQLNEILNISNTIIMNNGIDVERFSEEKDKFLMRKEIGVPDDSFLIGHIGRFTYVKNHLFLLEIFAEIKKLNRKAKLLLVGMGEYEDKIIRRIAELHIENDVIILNNRIDIPDLLKMMDMFIFPSILEGLGIAVIEAQVAGIKCIVSDRVPKEAAISNQVKFMELKHNPAEWANAALKFYEDKTPLEYFDIQKWSMRDIIKNLESIYEYR